MSANDTHKNLHVISFDVPFPANYGGAIDVYYKLKALFNSQVKIHLHCFGYERELSSKLNEICSNVYYYKRHVSKAHLFKRRPYIVNTRVSEVLMKNLLKDDYPILFEGIHSSYYLDDKRLADRRKIVRAHNVEHDYYQALANVEGNIFRRYYFHNEAAKLKRYEKILDYADGIAAISGEDDKYFSKKYGKSELVSAFHPNDELSIKEGSGKFALYHGSLSVGENNQAALFLVNEVFNDIDIPLIIAGNKPSERLREAVKMSPNKNISIKDDISTDEIFNLIYDAHVNVLPTFQPTGIKLKLLAALYNGRFCLANSFMTANTGLESLCVVKDAPSEFKQELVNLFKKEFSTSEIEGRKEILLRGMFSNDYNARKLTEMFFLS